MAATKQPNELFESVSKSVWTVLAGPSLQALEKRVGVAQGSAVAVSTNTLLTNCHVVRRKTAIVIKHAKIQVSARVLAGDATTDRCILAVEEATLQPVSGYRKFETLTVGESVYTIGSPHGLENTLGQGIISGLREAQKRHFVQTTAQVSPGSSGGGLFDPAGNLVGITTFQVMDSDGLNFAIAVEDFVRD